MLSRERFLCRPLTVKLGIPGSLAFLVTRMPSSITAVSNSNETAPVARLTYQSAVEELISLTSSRIGNVDRREVRGGSERALQSAFG